LIIFLFISSLVSPIYLYDLILFIHL